MGRGQGMGRGQCMAGKAGRAGRGGQGKAGRARQGGADRHVHSSLQKGGNVRTFRNALHRRTNQPLA